MLVSPRIGSYEIDYKTLKHLSGHGPIYIRIKNMEQEDGSNIVAEDESDEEMLDKKTDHGKSIIRKNRKINSKDIINTDTEQDDCLNEQEEDRMVKSNVAYLESLKRKTVKQASCSKKAKVDIGDYQASCSSKKAKVDIGDYQASCSSKKAKVDIGDYFVSTKIQCPVCFQKFSNNAIEEHASLCAQRFDNKFEILTDCESEDGTLPYQELLSSDEKLTTLSSDEKLSTLPQEEVAILLKNIFETQKLEGDLKLKIRRKYAFEDFCGHLKKPWVSVQRMLLLHLLVNLVSIQGVQKESFFIVS